jgi:hypothetical protein
LRISEIALYTASQFFGGLALGEASNVRSGKDGAGVEEVEEAVSDVVVAAEVGSSLGVAAALELELVDAEAEEAAAGASVSIAT